MGMIPDDVFLEGYPKGTVAIVKQKDGQYRIIVSRPPNGVDAVLARAELALDEILEDFTIERQCKGQNPAWLDGDED